MQRERRAIDVGLLVVGRIDPADLSAVRDLRTHLHARLSTLFPEFEWRLPWVEQADGREGPLREEPSLLLETGAMEREARRWDFALVITGADLHAQLRPSTLATPSQALAVAAISLARIGPSTTEEQLSPDARHELLAHRLETLALQCLCHLAGLTLTPAAGGARQGLRRVERLDQPLQLSEAAREELRQYYRGVADARVEEEPERHASVVFYALALARNLRNVLGSIRKTRPWLLPFRLSRLTAAALSTLLVLVNTAETWEVAGTHGFAFDVTMALSTLIGMTTYVLHKQRLLFSSQGSLTEQVAVARAIVFASIGIGLLATYGLMLVLTLLLGVALYPASVIQSWGGPPDPLTAVLRLAGFVAPLGIVIGGLGASFEQQHYVRHIAYVDEEL